MTLFHAIRADDTGAIEAAIKNGHHVDGAFNTPRPLIVAINYGYLKAVNTLLDHGANPNLTSDRGVSPLIMAVEQCKLDIVKRLLNHPNIAVDYADTHAKQTALFYAFFKHTAAQANLTNYERHCRYGSQDIERFNQLQKDIDDSKEIILLLLENGANLNHKNERGSTILHSCASMGWCKLVEMLLSNKGVKINAQDNNGDTPLHLASAVGHFDIVFELLSRKADPTIKNDADLTPADKATKNNFVRSQFETLEKEGFLGLADMTKAELERQAVINFPKENKLLRAVYLSKPKVVNRSASTSEQTQTSTSEQAQDSTGKNKLNI